MTFYDPSLNISGVSATYHIDSTTVTLVWDAPTGPTADHVIIYQGTGDWSTASSIGTVSAATTTFNATQPIDGTARFYWPICYNADASYGGQTDGVSACQVNASISGATFENGDQTVITPTFYKFLANSGVVETDVTAAVGGWTEGFPTPTADPGAHPPIAYPPGAAVTQAVIGYTNDDTSMGEQLNGVSEPFDTDPSFIPPYQYALNAAAAPVSGHATVADGIGISFGGSCTLSFVAGPGTSPAWGLPNPPNPNPFKSAIATDCSATWKISYTGPGYVHSFGDVARGGPTASPPSPGRGFVYSRYGARAR